ncbi:HAMP domain-containing sensor histidine kinase [uncultured Vagococcus sp.]|uniref:sensor histidine kinase n=1 Tax=uncultured Vagococcus sp. TaxID=189676 RepID=UPI0028D3D901|nr:HAMP domain-containing sensor histidine kinase [uncultured Vagococcus sp.]
MKQRQYKISIRLSLILFGVLAMVFIGLLVLTHFFLPNYYAFQIDQNVELAMKAFKKGDRDREEIEQLYGVTIVTSEPDKFVLDDLNDDLLLKMKRKGIALNRFWVSEESLEALEKGAPEITRNYDQLKQKSSYLAKLAIVDQQVVVVGRSMAHFSETAAIMNRFFFISLGLVLVVGMGLIYLTTKQLLKPLTVIKESAEKIAELDYVTISDYPANELGDLAHSLNVMSEALKQNQARLNLQNQQIRQLTADLTHELKTPIAVIQAYALGIEDGIDDGTYHQVILKQAEQLDKIVSDMLAFSKTSQLDFPLVPLDLLAILKSKLTDFESLAHLEKKELRVAANFEWQKKKAVVLGNEYLLSLVMDNLLSNGIRYGGNVIEIKLEKVGTNLQFEISNQLPESHETLVDLSKLWQPFVVGQESRNKELTGTGLGLSIVEHALTQHGTKGVINIDDRRFSVTVVFELIESIH